LAGRIAPLFLVAALTSVAVCSEPAAHIQEPSVETVLSRAADYVANFNRQLSGIVAEEFYIQEVRQRQPSGAIAQSRRRELRSDFLLVLPDGADRYVEFRDVFQVDGNAVRDRDERLTKLFLSPDPNVDQMREVIEESARHNIGDIPRNINTPMLPLYFLLPAQQPRFKFERSKKRTPNLTGYEAPRGGTANFRVTTDVWVIEFEETRRATVIRTNEGRDFPAAGRYWIEPDTGTVLMTELIMDRGSVRAVIDVSYESELLLGFRVPVEMRERYDARGARIDGVARYGKFRQFQVRTDENIQTRDPTKRKPPGW
jgi:hypothetical protein